MLQRVGAGKRIWTIVGTAVVAAIVLGGCSGAQSSQSQKLSGRVTAVGSTALLPLAKVAAEQFMDQNSGVTINVSGGGSFTGLTQVASGAAEVGMSDVYATPDLADKNLVDHIVAVAPFLIVVNQDVTVDNLTQDQLTGIFTGKISNWKDVGGKDEKITIIHRAKSSGSRATITQIVLKGQEFTDQAVIQDSNGKVRDAIATTLGSIGYIDAAYLKGALKALKYNGVAYSKQTLGDGKYPIYAFEHLYTKGRPTGATKAFLDYVLSQGFQDANVEKAGFVPTSVVKSK